MEHTLKKALSAILPNLTRFLKKKNLQFILVHLVLLSRRVTSILVFSVSQISLYYMLFSLQQMLNPAGSRHGDRPDDHNLRTRASHRLQQAVHVARHLHHDQETSKTKTRRFQLPEPVIQRNLGVRNFQLHRGEHRPVHRLPLLPV